MLAVALGCAPQRPGLSTPAEPPAKAVAAPPPSTTIASAASVADPRSDATDAVFQAFARDDRPGCAVAVSEHGRKVLSRAYGMANLDYGLRLTPETRFYLASTTKQITALTVALLARDGLLSLDDDIRKYVPQLPDYGATVRVEQLIHQTSGIMDHSVLAYYAGRRADDVMTVDDALELIEHQPQLNFAPGTNWSYSNANYVLLEVLVQRVTGRSLAQVAAERIFTPLGMAHSLYREHHGTIVPNRATGYAEVNGRWIQVNLNADTAGPGGLYSTPEDLLRWSTQLSDKTLGAELQQAQVTSGRLADGTETGYGYGLFLRPVLGQRAYEHDGGVDGYRSELLYFPDAQLAVAVACNASDADAPDLGHKTASIFLPAAPQTAAPSRSPSAATAVTENARVYAGIYWSRDAGAVNHLELDGAMLRLRINAETVRDLRALGGGSFEVLGASVPMTLTFAPPLAGRSPHMTKLRDSSPATHWQRVEPPDLRPATLRTYAGAYRSVPGATWVFRVDADKLIVRRPHETDAILVPVFRDGFRDGPDGDILFFDGRDWIVNNERIHALRFTRAR